MRKQVFGRQLQRDTNERKALFKSLMGALIINESIKTTEAKAKAVKGQIEKIVTRAKNEGAKSERILQGYFTTSVVRKLINEVAPRFVDRPGGYTRIIKTGNRLRDNAKMVILEWVEKKPEVVLGEVMNQEETKGTEGSNVAIEATAQIEKPKKADKKEKKEAKKPSVAKAGKKDK
jgi:large subunit ribosomal protein L17